MSSEESLSASEEDPQPRVSGLGHASRKEQNNAYGYNPEDIQSSSEEDTAAAATIATGIPSSFGGARARFRKRQRLDQQKRRAAEKQSRFSKAASSEAAQDLGDGASWEKHTRGIASKILAKYGFNGRLGKNEDGRTKPLVARSRPRNLGLGAGDLDSLYSKDDDDELDKRNDAIPVSLLQQLSTQRQTPPRPDNEKDYQPTQPTQTALAMSHLERAEAEVEAELFAGADILPTLRMLSNTAAARMQAAKRKSEAERLISQAAKAELERVELEAGAMRVRVDILESAYDIASKLQDAASFKGSSTQVKDFFESLAATCRSCEDESLRKTLLHVLCQASADYAGSMFSLSLSKIMESGKADRKSASQLSSVLAVSRSCLNEEAHLKVCLKAVLTPLHRMVSSPSWDTVKGACVADFLSGFTAELPDAVLSVFAEDILVPKLVGKLRSEYRENDASKLGNPMIPMHIWIHPWLPVLGRRYLAEVLHHVRTRLSADLESWHPLDDKKKSEQLVDIVRTWSTVLSRRKLQLVLCRHVIPKIAESLSFVGSVEKETPPGFWALRLWIHVISNRMLASAVEAPLLEGPGTFLKDLVLLRGSWDSGKEYYTHIAGMIPKEIKVRLQHVLAAMLFVLHAGRVVDSADLRAYLRGAPILGLQKNRFMPVQGSNFKQKTPKKKPNPTRNNTSDKGRLEDVIDMVGRREGLEVILEGTQAGMKVFRVGTARVIADVRRGVLVSGGRVVSVDELVNLNKGRK